MGADVARQFLFHFLQRRHVDGETGAALGEITSGTFSPTLKVGIALALLDTAAGLVDGDEVLVDVRGRASRFAVTTPPFVDRSTR